MHFGWLGRQIELARVIHCIVQSADWERSLSGSGYGDYVQSTRPDVGALTLNERKAGMQAKKSSQPHVRPLKFNECTDKSGNSLNRNRTFC